MNETQIGNKEKEEKELKCAELAGDVFDDCSGAVGQHVLYMSRLLGRSTCC